MTMGRDQEYFNRIAKAALDIGYVSKIEANYETNYDEYIGMDGDISRISTIPNCTFNLSITIPSNKMDALPLAILNSTDDPIEKERISKINPIDLIRSIEF